MLEKYQFYDISFPLQCLIRPFRRSTLETTISCMLICRNINASQIESHCSNASSKTRRMRFLSCWVLRIQRATSADDWASQYGEKGHRLIDGQDLSLSLARGVPSLRFRHRPGFYRSRVRSCRELRPRFGPVLDSNATPRGVRRAHALAFDVALTLRASR